MKRRVGFLVDRYSIELAEASTLDCIHLNITQSNTFKVLCVHSDAAHILHMNSVFVEHYLAPF